MSGARDVLAQLRLPEGELWIDRATREQLRDALAALEGEAPYTYVTRPRGGSKTLDGAGCSLAWVLTAPAGARGYLAAADRDQAGLALDSLRGFCERSPELRSRVEIERHRVIARDSGASVETLAADAASSWGLRPEWLVADEYAWWADVPSSHELWESLSSAIAKSPSARMLVLTSPSDPSHFAHRVLEHARSDELWRVSEWTGLVPWLDRRRVEEQRRRLPEAMFRRLFLGEWAEGDETLAVSGDVEAAISHSGPLDPQHGVRYVLGADLGVRRDRTALAVAHQEGERVVVDRLALWKGSRLRPVQLGEVERVIEQAARSYNGAELICDPWQALQLMERLRGRGLKVREFTFSQASTSRLAGTMVDLLRGQRLGLPDDPELIEELRAVRLIERSPGSWRIDHGPSGHDDQIVAIALAAQQLLRQPKPGPPASTPFHPWGRRRPRPRVAANQRDGSPERPFLYFGSPRSVARFPR